MNLTELRNEFMHIAKEIEPLALKSRDGDLTDAEDTRFTELTDQLNQVGEQITNGQNRQEAQRARAKQTADLIDRMGESRGSVAVGNAAVTSDQAGRYDPVSIADRFVKSSEFDAYRKHPVGSSGRVDIRSTYFVDRAPERGYDGSGSPVDTRAVVHTGSFAGYIQPYRMPGIVAKDEFPLRVRDVLTNGRTDTNTIEFVKKTGFTNNASGVPESTVTNGTTLSQGVKPESATMYEVETTTVKTIAHWIPISRQMLQDAAQMQTLIEVDLLYGLRKKEDDQLVNGAGTTGDLNGLLNTSGIQDLDTTYWAANKLPSDANVLDAIRRAKKTITLAGGSTSTFVLAHPSDVEVWETLKDANGNYLLKGGGPDNGGVPRIWSLPIAESLSVDEGIPLIGDGRRAIVFDRMDGSIFMSDSHESFFIKNLIAILAESRLAFAVLIPEAFALVDLDAAMTNRAA